VSWERGGVVDKKNPENLHGDWLFNKNRGKSGLGVTWDIRGEDAIGVAGERSKAN
jgi:hypothetical protein